MFKGYKIIAIFIFFQIYGMQSENNITLLPITYATTALSLFNQSNSTDRAPLVDLQNPCDCHIYFLVHINTKLPWQINYFYKNDNNKRGYLSDHLSDQSDPQGIILYGRPNYKPMLQSLIITYMTIFSQLKNNWRHVKFNVEKNCHEIAKFTNFLNEEHTLIFFLFKKYNFNPDQVEIKISEQIATNPTDLSIHSKIQCIYLKIHKDVYSLFKETLQFNIANEIL